MTTSETTSERGRPCNLEERMAFALSNTKFRASKKKSNVFTLIQELNTVAEKVNVAIFNPFKVAGFESKERQRSSEIKEDGLHFVLRGSEELYLNIY